MALESSLLPVPSEIVMPFSGYLASTGRFHLLLAATAGAIGCNIGSTFIYWLGATGGRAFAEKWGPYILITRAKLDRVDRYFERWGSATIFFTRLLPMIPVVVSFPAGIARMNIWKFELYTFAGCWIWCFALSWLGFAFGRAWKSQPWVKSAIHYFDVAIIIAVVLALTWLGWRLARRKPREA
jgi:membrane protein DedA with SNARE-associated domain